MASARERLPSSIRWPALPRPIGLALVFLAASAITAMTLLEGIQPNDEGLMLQAAARIADGQVPYRDFWWYYPPGQPYLLATLWDVFGPSLVTWRIVRLFANAVVALLLYLLVRRRAGVGIAVVAALTGALAMAYPSGPHPFPIALALALAALLRFERSPVTAGILAGACAAWRIEFAAYLGIGVLAAYLLRPRGSEAGAARRFAPAMRFAASGGLAAALLFGPVVGAAGLSASWELLVEYPLLDFGDYQSLPLPLLYSGPLNTSSISGFLGDSVESVLQFYLPAALVLGLAAAFLTLGLRARRDRDWPLVAPAIFAVGMAHYMLVRPDEFHTTPLAVMTSIFAGWALAGERRPGRSRRAALAASAIAGVSLTYTLVHGIDRVTLVLREANATLEASVADGVRIDAASRPALERTIEFLRSRVPPGEPIYVATRRADLVTSGHPLLYRLVDRPNPTRYDIAAPGVVTSAPVQQEIVSDLERARPAFVVRFTAPVTAVPEPNRAGRSSGVTILDDYLAESYGEAARFGPYVVLERHAGSPLLGSRRYNEQAR